MIARSEESKRSIIADLHPTLVCETCPKYVEHRFHVKENAVEVGAILTYSREHRVQMYVSLHDPNGFRGNRMNLSGYGPLTSDLWVGINGAGPGGIAGPLPAGEWTAQLDINYLNKNAPYDLLLYAVYSDETVDYVPLPTLRDRVIKSEEGWYKGELHCHSIESDGDSPVERVTELALAEGLDYLAVTDHYTTSQWNKLAAIAPDSDLVLMHSCEITSRLGHANMHGLNRWVNVFIDKPGWSMTHAARDTHAQGGLFCVNHAYSGGCSWKDFKFDWREADLMEIYHDMEGPNNHRQITLWDQKLNEGLKITGVGGTDNHHFKEPYKGNHRLITWVHAKELSEKGVIEALKAGRAYVSRGAEMRFEAVNHRGERAEMGGEITANGNSVRFELGYCSNLALHLFIYRDGMLWDSYAVEDSAGEWKRVTFDVPADLPGIFRVELHEEYKDPNNKGIEWNDFTTVQALSNPIWMKE